MRQIDCVTVKGSVRPMGLFTYDVTLEAVPLPSLYAWGGAATPASQMPRKVRHVIASSSGGRKQCREGALCGWGGA